MGYVLYFAFIGLPGHPVFNCAWYGYRYQCRDAYNALTYQASTS